jgi:L-alanine-DL-glutamate epimerase-like enolase superfamily enzyme
MQIAAGEYGYEEVYFRRMLAAGSVDVLQADATRCTGVTGLLRADALCTAFMTPLSCHCAPALHCQPAASVTQLLHVECFRDHVTMEHCLFEGAPSIEEGALQFDSARPGHGLALRTEEVRRHAY